MTTESTRLVYRKLHGYKYDIRSTTSIRVNCPYTVDTFYYRIQDGFMYVFVGYAYDGPSGPTIDTPNFMLGSLVHDVFYQAMREGQLPRSFRKTADDELRRICIEQGMSSFRAWYVYNAVRISRGWSARPEKNPRGQVVRLEIKGKEGG